MVTTDWGALYLDQVRRVSVLVTALPDDQLALRVPATPAWTVRDVVAHLAGGPATILADDADDAPQPSWTARHVAARAGTPVAELLDELNANAASVAQRFGGSSRPAIVWDLVVHHADLREALGLPPEPGWEPVLAAVVGAFDGLPTDGVSPYELFRAAFSRRSQRQLDSLFGGVVEPGRLRDVGIFGPRDDDQPVPSSG